MTKIRKLQAEVLLLTGSKPKEVKGWFPDSIRIVPVLQILYSRPELELATIELC